jgi:N6-adenosine-specific RNA methylase IME4
VSALAVELEFTRFVRLEERIAGAEGEGLRARWEFGHELLRARDGKGRLPNGYLTKLCEQTGASRSELTFRSRFAEQFPTEAELSSALDSYGSWHRLIADGLRKGAALVEADSVSDPGTGYGTITADPPWQYGNTATRAAAEDHYPTMTVEQLCELPVAEWSADHAHLYLWTTNGFLRQAFDVLEAWGFEYKTTLVWVKPQLGIGNYFRSSTEYVLFGVKGGLRTLDGNQRNWFEAKRGRHSKKPGLFFDLVEKVSPGPFLEMFARERRLSEASWDYWGNEA